MKVLIIEDDERIALPVKEELEHQRYLVELALEGRTGLELAKSGQFDIILLDLMLPQVDGISICQALRESGNSVPILMLTARAMKDDKILGLDAGADDYLTKPFDLDELSARLRALLRRLTPQKKVVLSCGSLSVNTATCEARFADTLVDVTPTEYRLLAHFLRNPDTIFNRESLIERLWLGEDAPGDEAIKTHIKTLRKKLSAAGAPRNLIETNYGFGYKLTSAAC